jgi:chemotaxis protein CheX
MKNHTFEKGPTFDTLKLGEVLTLSDCKEFDSEIDDFIQSSKHHLIVDFSIVTSLSKDWIRSLLRLQMGLRKKTFQMRVIATPPLIATYLKTEGIDSAFHFCATLKDALQELGLGQKRSLDIEFVNPFLEATLRVLEVQANVKAKAGKVCLKKADSDFHADISGIIGIVSDGFNGSVVISFPEQTFLKIMSSMLGDEFTEINKDILDGAGEITNMIFGQAKISLNEKGYGIKTALPSVVHGKNHMLSSQNNGGPVVIIPFESMVGGFHVEICLSA